MYNSECTCTTVKHGRKGFMLCGTFLDAGTAELLTVKSINNKVNKKLSTGLPTRLKQLKKSIGIAITFISI